MATSPIVERTESTDASKSAPRGFAGRLRLWFLLRDPVGRRDYALSGIGLAAFKYGVEALVAWWIADQFYSPFDFINPLVSSRAFLRAAPDWAGMAWVIWSLPFLWIAVNMSVRRALDAGISPWSGLLILIPFVNLLMMLLVLPSLPTRQPAKYWDHAAQRLRPLRPLDVADTLKSAVGGVAVGALYGTVMLQLGSTWLDDLGEAMFLGTPFIAGVAAGYILNLRTSYEHLTTAFAALLSILLCFGALLVFAFEGFFCIVMAAPLAIPVGVAGAPIGKFLADRRRRIHSGLIGALLIVPLWASVEWQLPHRNEFVVTSTVDIAAPPSVVWQHVIAFPDITDEPEWLFRWGIACPQGARITGSGVGATRECIFTTGTFVEPITTWDAPRRLAFDVRDQPAPMFELSPYRDLHPPHLDNAFRSTRGELELVDLGDGHTRLVGRTWYTLNIRPLEYWTLWTDWLIHRIHLRVLRHIQHLSESSGEAQ
jgi:uncharacterized membrane protein YhaH (DUF805 family)